MGYNQRAISLASLQEVKYDGAVVSKYKTRIVALGHPGNVTP
eukprot:SAG31_NODE_8635_length_1410_cov_37.674260_1_plen_41_part_10